MTSTALPSVRLGMPARIRSLRSLTFMSWLAIVVLALILLTLILGPLLVPHYAPRTQSLERADLGLFATDAQGVLHILGTDPLGTDTLSQLILGGEISLVIAVSATVIAAVIGPIAGVLAGYLGGVVDRIVGALVEVQLAVPRILIVVTVVAVFGPSVPLLIVLLGVTGWAGFARLVRAQALSLREREFVDASVAMGAGRPRILLRHILPHTLNSVVVLGSLELGAVVVTEAALSYLGLGVQPPDTSWGLMIQQSQQYLSTDPRLLMIPSIALVLFVFSSNFVARLFTSEAADSRRATRAKIDV
jgi:peptide/nickel transport system permease protein